MVNENLKEEFSKCLKEYNELAGRASMSLIKFMDSYQNKLVRMKPRIKYDRFEVTNIRTKGKGVTYIYTVENKDGKDEFIIHIASNSIQFSCIGPNATYIIPFHDDNVMCILDILDYHLESNPNLIIRGNFSKYERNINIRGFQFWVDKTMNYYKKYETVKKLAFLSGIIDKEKYLTLP